MLQVKFNILVRSAILIIIGLSLISPVFASDYVTVLPKSGDAVMTIFKKYKISPCTENINYFKKINGIKQLDKLLIGKHYKLPILKLPFDGKSIATSIPHISKASAKNVMNYNKALYRSQLRKKPYLKNKIVWIVYDEWNHSRSKISPEVKYEKTSLKLNESATSRTRSEASLFSKEKKLKALNTAPELIEKALEPNAVTAEATVATKKTNEAAANLTATGIRTKIVPVFGPDYEEIRIQSDILKDKVYYLVSGHGGPDPGTMFHGDNHILCEDEYAYDVTLRLARKLMEQGAKVYLIVQDPDDGIRNETYLKMDKDERCITGFPLVLNQRLRLTQTTDAVNDLYRINRKNGVPERDQLAIHIHVDSRHKDMRKDVFFYYQENNSASEAMAKNIQQTLERKYQERSGREYTGTVSSRNLFVMRNTIPATVYMELGNIQNDGDQKRLLFSSNRQALAEWLYDGIAGE